MAVELDELSGDVAGLIGYHRRPGTGMVHDDDIAKMIYDFNIRYIGSVNLEITAITAPFDAAIQKTLAEIPIPTSGDRWLTYLPPPDDEFPRAGVILATVAVLALYLAFALLFAFGVLDAANNGGTAR